MKRTGIVGAAGAAAAILTVGVVMPAQASESHRGSGDSFSSVSSSTKHTQDNDSYSSVNKILNDTLNGFNSRDNDRNGILNGDDHILSGDSTVGNVGDISLGDIGNVSDVANGNFSGNEVLNGNDTLNGNEFGNVDTGDIASGDVSTGDIASGNSVNGGDVNVLNDAEILNDTLDVVDNTLSNTLNDVLNTDRGSQWGGGDWQKW
ncbi:hypothetical protein [Herbiconiux sp. L3-i23]|uniref:hypothetical protein n=1 Tax=Herbiconiux sp. L3-i23 TaxID=2905871 RepID=UPI0020737D43|nr:hypothetical protein [Herbiconiux sp. L3-i23]